MSLLTPSICSPRRGELWPNYNRSNPSDHGHDLPAALAPWRRQPGEPGVAYRVFCCYRDMGPKRSLDAVGRQLYPEQVGRKRGSTGRLRAWSAAWRWAERAAAWDDDLARQAEETMRDAVVEMSRRHAEQAVALQRKALRRLKRLKPEDLSPRDVLRFFVEGVKIERLARGVPEMVTEQRTASTPLERTDSLSRAALADPAVADLVCELFERVAALDAGEQHG